MKKDDHYEALGVPKNASPDEVKRAYRHKVKKTHPDKGGDSEEFLAVQRAWQTLGDQENRERYDRTGQDAEDASIEVKAAQMLAKIIVMSASSCPDPACHDILEFARKNLRDEMANQRKTIASLQQKAEKLRAAGNRIKIKSGDNYLTTALRTAAANSECCAQTLEKQLEIGNELLRQLDLFSYKTDGPAPFTQPRSPFESDLETLIADMAKRGPVHQPEKEKSFW